MKNSDMTDGFPFGIKRSLHLQGALMCILIQNSALAPALKAEIQAGLPTG
jgi:hypothetical protein